MDFLELARSRHSCKKFDSRQISKELFMLACAILCVMSTCTKAILRYS